jgi:hypothetical protein
LRRKIEERKIMAKALTMVAAVKQKVEELTNYIKN